jgi:pyridoxine 5-phosphate synthase
MAKLGVNVDHVATLRNQRGTPYPDPVEAALIAQQAGADQITVHLREDQRHIVPDDVVRLREVLTIPLNLEMANTTAMVEFAQKIKPDMISLVPEKREEKTTEGGLDLSGQFESLQKTIALFNTLKIPVSLFIEPTPEAIELSHQLKAPMVELHTGRYAELTTPYTVLDAPEVQQELQRITFATQIGLQKGIVVHAGHGLNYENTLPIVRISGMGDLNIGHSLVCDSVFLGFFQAIARMKALISGAP